MISFAFTAEQIKSAPPEVRQWIEAEIHRALTTLTRPALGGEQPQPHTLAECSPAEAAEILNAINGNFLATRVFFELARETPHLREAPQLHLLDVGDILRHTQLTDPRLLGESFNAINRALQMIRNDAELSLFGSDEAGHTFVHETTHRSIRRLWQQLLGSQAMQSVPASPTAPLDDRIQLAPERAFPQPTQGLVA
jgi:hypothetical protein